MEGEWVVEGERWERGKGWERRGGVREGRRGEGEVAHPFLKFLDPPLLVENTVLPRGYASASDSVCHPGQLQYHWILRVSLAIRPLRKGCYMFLCNRVKFQGLTFSTGFM